ncbi:hypothetical protein BGZ70_004598 [Mortierella alpina]|uniref:Uncharacterized protein n=1 Tax=Mortierella alpina TaxID=64518 RepID=A0A9P6IR36_MORAP|nr:hypothetical protein BGZ70_004598 [Mortierella alpina]
MSTNTTKPYWRSYFDLLETKAPFDTRGYFSTIAEPFKLNQFELYKAVKPTLEQRPALDRWWSEVHSRMQSNRDTTIKRLGVKLRQQQKEARISGMDDKFWKEVEVRQAVEEDQLTNLRMATDAKKDALLLKSVRGSYQFRDKLNAEAVPTTRSGSAPETYHPERSTTAGQKRPRDLLDDQADSMKYLDRDAQGTDEVTDEETDSPEDASEHAAIASTSASPRSAKGKSYQDASRLFEGSPFRPFFQYIFEQARSKKCISVPAVPKDIKSANWRGLAAYARSLLVKSHPKDLDLKDAYVALSCIISAARPSARSFFDDELFMEIEQAIVLDPYSPVLLTRVMQPLLLSFKKSDLDMAFLEQELDLRLAEIALCERDGGWTSSEEVA